MSKAIIIFGFHPILAELDAHPDNFIGVFLLNNRNDTRLNGLVTRLNQLGIHSKRCDKAQLNKLAKNQAHQGVVAEILPPALPNQAALMDYIGELNKLKKNHLILILDSIQDPRNLGACLRSANAAGADCVVINKDGSAPINALVYKTSAGALNTLKIFQVTNLSRSICALKENNIWVIGLKGSTQKSLYQIDLTPSSAIVIGAEGFGLRRLTQKSCDQLAMIPMHGNVESLNVSVATGIALFETNRQRNQSQARSDP